jgi:hypothetical protein
MNTNLMTLDEFIALLHKLDKRINCNIVVKAIGGFSLMLNSQVLKISPLDARFMSGDIDSFTEDYEAEVDRQIALVGKEYGLESVMWLNNDWAAARMYSDDLINEATWLDYDREKFEHIELFYLNLESLLKFKVRALYVNETMNKKARLNDLKDVDTILNYFQEDLSNLSPQVSALFNRYPGSLEIIQNYVSGEY